MSTSTGLQFDNRFGQLSADFYTRQGATSLPGAHLVCASPAAAELIGLDAGVLGEPEWIEFFGGERMPLGADPLAMVYSGHQFGVYVPQLGDGRGLLLGEVMGNDGQRWDLHLKGAGKTPYSRSGDGRAVLRSSIREFLCSEAMHALGIPTSRALMIIAGEESVWRETLEPCAVLVRLARSHVRFGSFEFFHYGKQPERVRELADYVIKRNFPALGGGDDRYTAFFAEVVGRTARLIAKWQAVGWGHGVMNTDNMSVIGDTFDYGPFGFMDSYDPNFVCNHSDHQGRYAYCRQPGIGLWNCAALGEALSSLVATEELKRVLATYEPEYNRAFAAEMRAKLGFFSVRQEDAAISRDLLALLTAAGADYSLFFRHLADVPDLPSGVAAADVVPGWADEFTDRAALDAWLQRYRARLGAEQVGAAERRRRMQRVNPKYVLRNYLAQQAIERATEHRDYSEVRKLLEILSRPFDEQPGNDSYVARPPEWARGIQVSCSS